MRVMIGKVEYRDRLAHIMRSTPVMQGELGWNCVSWIKAVLRRLQADNMAMGTSLTEWRFVRDAAMRFCQRMREQHRFDGTGNFDTRLVATCDILQGKEIVPVAEEAGPSQVPEGFWTDALHDEF